MLFQALQTDYVACRENGSQSTILMKAITAGHDDIIRELLITLRNHLPLMHQRNPNSRVRTQLRIVGSTLKNGFSRIISPFKIPLIRGPLFFLRNLSLRTPTYQLALLDFLNAVNEDGETALSEAVHRGKTSLVLSLLELGATREWSNQWKASTSVTQIMCESLQYVGDPEVLVAYLKWNSDELTEPDGEGNTVMHYFTGHEIHPGSVQSLVPRTDPFTSGCLRRGCRERIISDIQEGNIAYG